MCHSFGTVRAAPQAGRSGRHGTIGADVGRRVHILSIDLGTSNTVAVLSTHGRPPRVVELDGSATMPSAVFAGDDGTLLVGRDAERRARLDPARYEPNPKRRVDEGSLLLGDTIVPVTTALAAVLGRVADEAARQLDGAHPDEVRLTHPAQWGPVRRGVLLGAAHRTDGLGGTLLPVPEPVAAAAHFASFPGRTLRPGQALAVYDLGAGTFDCAVVGATADGFVVLAEDGLPDLGGLDVDQALAEHLGRQVSFTDPTHWQRLLRPETTADRRAQRAMREDVRTAKEALSRHPQTEVPMPDPFADALVTRGELEALIRPNLLRSVDVLAATIQRAGLAPRSLAGIYLVGGSSRIPLVASLISAQLGTVPTSLDQPETAVALGAHHVPRDGMTTRTGEFTGPHPTLAPQPTTAAQPIHPTTGSPAPHPAGPHSTGPHSSGRQSTGSHSTGPQSAGPHSADPRSTYPTTGPQAVHPQRHPAPAYGRQPQPSTKQRGRTLLIAAGAVVVVAVAAVVAVLATRGPDLPAAADCADQGTRDGEGFTRCLRQLAGATAQSRECSTTRVGEPPLSDFVGVSVSCDLGGAEPRFQVYYTHSDQGDAAQVLSAMASATDGDRVEAEWAGNGLRGRYVSTVDDGRGVLVFAVGDRPLFGTLTAEDGDITPETLADYFEHNVQPGT